MTLDDYLKLPEKYIPDGMYCYDKEVCPFWDSKPGEYPKQEDGYCHYLGKSDWDINHEHEDDIVIVHSHKGDEIGKPLKEIYGDPGIDSVSGKQIHFPSSLIWDQCKECGINYEDPDDVEYVTLEVDVDSSLLKSIKGNKK